MLKVFAFCVLAKITVNGRSFATSDNATASAGSKTAYPEASSSSTSSLPDPEGFWQVCPNERMIRRRAIQDKDTIGDLRITYQVPCDIVSGSRCSVLGFVDL